MAEAQTMAYVAVKSAVSTEDVCGFKFLTVNTTKYRLVRHFVQLLRRLVHFKRQHFVEVT